MALTGLNCTIVDVENNFLGLLVKPISSMYNAAKNLTLLEDELNHLMDESADTERLLEAEEAAQQTNRTNRVTRSLQKRRHLQAEFNQVVAERNSYQQRGCLDWCYPSNWLAYYSFVEKITQLRKYVTNQTAAEFPNLVNPPRPPTVLEKHIGDPVGLDSMLSQVWTLFRDEHVGTIGFWGMGGVGKTTLLEKINKELESDSRGFDVVRWIDGQKLGNFDTISEDLRKDLGIKEDVWRNQSERGRVDMLSRALNKKKFLLLIDNVSEELKFTDIGIPIPKDGSKIVFTSRLLEVCGQLNAMDIEVKCLSPQYALQLFTKHVGENTLKLCPEISKIATQIADKCKGLPLALVKIGQAMSSMKTLRQWNSPLELLSRHPSKFGKMVDVYKLLKFNYDILDSTSRQCFLYCALFPKDSIINTYYLIDLWIAEGFLGDTDDICLKQLQCESILASLRSACLLESSYDEDHAEMHDVIREMALWIAREDGKEENKIIVEEEPRYISKWQQAERVSLKGHRIGINHIKNLLVCSRLVTLLINETDLENLPDEFFNSMAVLRVLDMSSNRGFAELPTSVKSLTKLQYLNLSGTKIKVLPDEMKCLTSLLYLLLDDTRHLKNIPKEVISSLSSLKVFRKSGEKAYTDEEGLVEGLECLDQLNELSLDVHTTSSAKRLLKSGNLQRSITVLNIYDKPVMPTTIVPTSSTEIIEKNEDVLMPVNDCPSSVLLTNLQVVAISGCDKLRCLSWLVYAPKLQVLNVKDGESFEKIINEDMFRHKYENPSAELFSSLRSLRLGILPNLISIYGGSLSCPLLKEIFVWVCPKLKKLPFDSNSGMTSLKVVRARSEWWSGLEWNDSATKDFFTSKLDELR